MNRVFMEKIYSLWQENSAELKSLAHAESVGMVDVYTHSIMLNNCKKTDSDISGIIDLYWSQHNK